MGYRVAYPGGLGARGLQPNPSRVGRAVREPRPAPAVT